MFRNSATSTITIETERQLERIAALEPNLHSFVTVMAESALAAARTADDAIGRGGSLGALHGMSIAVKDCIDVAGARCTNGSAFFNDNVPSEDAAVVKHLKASGAILIGKANLHEFAFGGTTQNAFFGACRNPWDRARIPGGSSGGSAVAVAAGLARGALGTDTGASIRMPAALCGVSGLRPTHRFTSLDGVFPVSSPLDTVGAMARSVADVARIQAAIADSKVCMAHNVAPDDLIECLDNPIDGVRIAVPDDFFFREAETDVSEAVLAAAKALERRGARLVSTAIPGATDVQSHQAPMLVADAARVHSDRLRAAPEKFSEGVRRRMLPGLEMTADDYADHQRWLQEWRQRAVTFFRDVAEIVLTPTVPVTAPIVEADENMAEVTRRLTLFSWVWPAAGTPALSIPCGFSAGLPIGMQLAAARWNDARLLSVGHQFQQATDWHRHEPPVG